MRINHIARQISVGQNSFDHQIAARRRQLANLEGQMITGRRVVRASDDPAAFAQAEKLEGLQNQYAQYQRAIDASQGWVDFTQVALDSVADIIAQAVEEGLQGANDTVDNEARLVLADSIDSLLDETIDQLNSKVDAEYLFAGTASGGAPFALDRTVDPPVMTYGGNDGERRRSVGPELKMTVNISGDRVMDTGEGFDIAEAFTNLSQALRNNDTEAINDAVGQLQTVQNHVLNLATEAGNTANRLTLSSTQLYEADIRIAARRSNLEDADLAEVITNIQGAQTGLQAALQTVTMIQDISILNYL